MEEKGLIIKGVGGFYTLLLDDGEKITAKAKGKFRIDGLSPVCGDRAGFLRQQDGSALITQISPRKNLLIRPQAANIDQLVIVVSLSSPKADLLLCDKLLIMAFLYDITPLIVFNKMDDKKEDINELVSQYQPHFSTIMVSALTGEGISCLSDALDNKTSCFAGQSAVGKSSLLNRLLPGIDVPVGGLARKTDRGKHTTRQCELWPYKKGAVLDTPGFSLLDIDYVDQEKLNAAYPEFKDSPEKCRFYGCVHKDEPGCAVKELIGNGLHIKRYERYLTLLDQFKESRKRKYD